jgi:hypothetical protein
MENINIWLLILAIITDENTSTYVIEHHLTVIISFLKLPCEINKKQLIHNENAIYVITERDCKWRTIHGSTLLLYHA